MKLNIITVDDDEAGVLRENVSAIVEEPALLMDVALDLMRLCLASKAAGLAAPQAGLRRNFFVMSRSYWSAKTCVGGIPKDMVFINPSFEPVGRLVKTDSEGCKSLPGVEFMVPRHFKIKASWDTLEGRRLSRTIWGHTARCFQHESDHLRGICIDACGTIIKSK